MAALQGLCYILGNADRAPSRIDEPRSLFHLGEELLVEQTVGGLVQRAILRHQHCLNILESGWRDAHEGHDVTL